jgi:hypothetical protein
MLESETHERIISMKQRHRVLAFLVLLFVGALAWTRVDAWEELCADRRAVAAPTGA